MSTKKRIQSIKNRVILNKAESLCVNFANKQMNAKQCLIRRLMKKVKLELQAPKRKVHRAVLVQAKKVQPCQGVECTLPCHQKANCPAQRIINGCHKKVSFVTSDNKGQCLIVHEVCTCNEFVIEYVGKSLQPKSL